MARILIVDDSPTETFRFKEILTKHGYDVLEASNGADGVTLAKAEQPDLVLMDVVMPGVNGFQATRQITRDEDTKHIPVVIVSTKDQATDRVWGKRQGAIDYLIKPIEEKQL
ncbi:response regulator, partial [Acinetobacter baumannii]